MEYISHYKHAILHSLINSIIMYYFKALHFYQVLFTNYHNDNNYGFLLLDSIRKIIAAHEKFYNSFNDDTMHPEGE